MLTRLGVASWEIIMRRSLMMAQGTCTFTEYQLMVSEKVAAMQASMLAAAQGRTHNAILAPYLTRTRANVNRLRRNS
jgi:uncharacterized membrane protein YpjA